MIFRLPENALSLFIAAGISLVLCIVAFSRRRNNPSAYFLSGLMLDAAVWTLMYIVELSAVTEEAQFTANIFAYIPIVAAPVLLLLFILSATGNINIITPFRTVLLFIIPLMTLILIASSRHHNLYYSWIDYIPEGDRNVIVIGRGLFYWVNIVYSYICLLTGTIYAFSSFIKSNGVFRTQSAILAAGVIIPWIGSLTDIIHGTVYGIHAMQASFTICGFIFITGIIRFRFTDIAPIGRHVMIEKMKELMLAVNQNDIVVDLNPALLKYLGKSRSDVIGKHVSEVFSNWEREVRLIRKIKQDSTELRLVSQSRTLYFDVVKTKISTHMGRPLGTLILMTDVTKRVNTELKLIEQLDQIKMLEKEVRERAIRDPLTDLFNRRFLEEVLHQYFARIQRGNGTIGLLFIDIDDFKILNDTYGHQAGDEVLRQLGKTLHANIRESDVACRYGGEEFMIVFLDTSLEEIFSRAEIMRKHFEAAPGFTSGSDKAITFSAGIALCPDNGKTIEQTIKMADEALYRAKTTGKNRIICFE